MLVSSYSPPVLRAAGNQPPAPPPAPEPKDSFVFRAARGTSGFIAGAVGAAFGAPIGAFRGATNAKYDVDLGPTTKTVVRGLTAAGGGVVGLQLGPALLRAAGASLGAQVGRVLGPVGAVLGLTAGIVGGAAAGTAAVGATEGLVASAHGLVDGVEVGAQRGYRLGAMGLEIITGKHDH